MGDVENLAKIIESKITILERLTNARIETNNQLERMHRAKTEALDTIEYTHFSVTMTENTYVDKEALTDSWKRVVQNTVFEINTLIQDLSIGFVAFLLVVIKFALYFGVVLVVIRFGWIFALRIWKNGGEGNIG
jgi:type III secretory pathway lipoprotein EscJ